MLCILLCTLFLTVIDSTQFVGYDDYYDYYYDYDETPEQQCPASDCYPEDVST